MLACVSFSIILQVLDIGAFLAANGQVGFPMKYIYREKILDFLGFVFKQHISLLCTRGRHLDAKVKISIGEVWTIFYDINFIW